MHADRFDVMMRAVTLPTRRAALGLTLSGVLAFLGLDDAEVKRKKRKRKKSKKCKPQSLAKTCAGKCGPVTNNCKKTVDCGAACGPGSLCLAGICEACGMFGDPCCPGNICVGGFCIEGQCGFY